MMDRVTLPPPAGDAGGTDPPADPSPSLDALLSSCAAGDQESFAGLYDASSARVFGLVLRVLRDRAQAEEVTQDVYLEIWRTAPRFDRARGSALAWMMTIAHRRAVDRVRSAQAATRRDTAYEAREQATPYDQTAEGAERNLDAERVREALGALTDNQRGAVELAFYGGYTHSEVASILGLPLGTAKTRIRDGLARLRQALGVQT